MRRNGNNTTSGHNLNSTIRLSDPENLIVMKLSLYGKGYAEELARNIIWDALHVTLYNRFWTLATLREYYFYLFIFLFELFGYFSPKSLRCVAWYPCKLKKAVKVESKCLKSSSKFRQNLLKFQFFAALLPGQPIRPLFIDKTRSTANLSAVGDT